MSDSFDRSVWEQVASDESPTSMVQRRILPNTPHDVYLAESRPVRRRSMRLDLGSALTVVADEQPQGLGFSTTIESVPGRTRFVLEAASPNDNELFAELSNDLAGVIAAADLDECADQVLSRVVAWQSFFRKARDPFTREQAAALFAELEVLAGTVVPALGAVTGVLSWHGPDPALQDFQYPSLAVEVKSFRGTGPGVLRISSEHQLEKIGVGDLYVAYLRLSQRAVGEGVTLGELIDRIRGQLVSGLTAADYFESQLLEIGWHDSFRPLRTEVYEVRALEFFEVTDEFPRIVSEMLPVGVHSTVYKIDRSALESFLVGPELMSELLGDASDI